MATRRSTSEDETLTGTASADTLLEGDLRHALAALNGSD